MELYKEKGCKIGCFRRWLNHFGIMTLQNEDQNVRDDGTWKSLPKDLMEKIACHLNSTAYIGSSMVCKSWKALLLESDILRPQMPWLLFPHRSSSHAIKFYNVLDDRFHLFRLPKGVEGSVVGCSKGWIIFMATVGRKTISLFNPISSANYLLPPPPTTLHFQRVELSSSHASNCIVAAIVNNSEGLAFYKQGDERWEVVSLLSESGLPFSLIDIVFCHQNLHVLVNSENDNGKIENIDIKLPSYSEVISITLVHDISYSKSDLSEIPGISTWIGFPVFSRHRHISYLVESIKLGQVILVQKHFTTFYIRQNAEANVIHDNENNSDDDEIEEEQENEHRNHEEEENDGRLKQILSNLDGFKVYEIKDLARKKRICKNLGKEQALFLSSKSRLCLTNASNELQENCVYFIMEQLNLDSDHHESYYMAINGIYHLDDFTVTPLISKFQVYWNPSFMWFAPNFQH